MRVIVASADLLRAAWPAVDLSRAMSPWRIWPATLLVTSPPGPFTKLSFHCSAVSGVTTFNTWPEALMLFATAVHCLLFAAVNNSATVWPGSIVTSVTMASPPNRFW